MRKFWAQSLRRQLFVAILLLLVPVMAAIVWSGFATFREGVRDLKAQSDIVAVTISAWVNRDISAIDRITDDLTQLEPVARLEAAPARELLRRARSGRPHLRDIILVDASGTLVTHAADAPSPIDPQWSREALRQSRRQIMSLPRVEGEPQHVIFAYPVSHGSARAVGALGFVISTEALHASLAALPLPAGSVITIHDASGRPIVRSELASTGSRNPGWLQRWLGGMDEAGERLYADGVRRVHGETTAHQGPWVVSVGIPSAVAWDEAFALWMRTSTIIGIGVLAWVLAVLVLSRRLGDTVSHLRATATRIASGDFGQIAEKPMRSREFAELQGSFTAMLQRFNSTRGALDAQMTEERRIRKELESLQGQVIRQERLAAVGQLVSGVAHEINNPLQAILGFAELLQMQPAVPDDAKADLRLIQKESARACGIIRNLALFARQQPDEAAPVHLTDVIRSVAELRQRRLESEDIELRVEDDSVQPVLAVATELQQVVLNFVINAEQAILASGRLPGRITIRTMDRTARVILEAEDTGPGVPSDNEVRLFEPFFTTKPVGQGTGLGLSVSYGIIDSLGGQIGYRRSHAGGSIFYFEIPAARVED